MPIQKHVKLQIIDTLLVALEEVIAASSNPNTQIGVLQSMSFMDEIKPSFRLFGNTDPTHMVAVTAWRDPQADINGLNLVLAQDASYSEIEHDSKLHYLPDGLVELDFAHMPNGVPTPADLKETAVWVHKFLTEPTKV